MYQLPVKENQSDGERDWGTTSRPKRVPSPFLMGKEKRSEILTLYTACGKRVEK